MPDTNNFPSFKQQFSAYTLPVLLDAREKVGEPYRSLITQAFNKLNEYFTDEEFRKTLPIGRKNSIEGQISNILAQFNQLNQWQIDGTPISGTNIENIYNNISSYLDDFDTRFSVPHELYRLQGNNNIDTVVNEAVDTQNKIKEVYDSINKVLNDANKLVGTASSLELADYFQDLSNGRSVIDNSDFRQMKRKTISIPKAKWVFPLSIVVLYLLIDKGVEVIKKAEISSETLLILSAAVSIPVAVFGVIYAINYINKTYKGGYARTAFFWMLGAVASTIFTAIYAAILVLQMGSEAGWEEIVPKIIGLLAPAYFVRFCVQNYKANMHLSIQNTHRATIARVVRPFSDLISHPNPSFEQDVLTGKTGLIHAAAEVVFSQSESGYLTTKEGAGSSDNMLDSLNRPKT